MMRRVVAKPSSFGMWISMVTTSGCSALHGGKGFLAIPGEAGDLDAGIRAQDVREQLPGDGRILHDQDADFGAPLISVCPTVWSRLLWSKLPFTI